MTAKRPALEIDGGCSCPPALLQLLACLNAWCVLHPPSQEFSVTPIASRYLDCAPALSNLRTAGALPHTAAATNSRVEIAQMRSGRKSSYARYVAV